MKQLQIVLIIIALSVYGCKKVDKFSGDLNKEYTVEGYIYKYKGDNEKPITNYMIVLSQIEDECDNAEFVSTDEDGYFILKYSPKKQGNFIQLYRYREDNCYFSSDIILKNLSKGKDLKLGKIYL